MNWQYAVGFNPNCPIELLHDEVVTMLRACRGRGQAYGAVAHQDADAAARHVTQIALLLTSPTVFLYATFDWATALFPQAQIAVTSAGNFQPSTDPEAVAAAIESAPRDAWRRTP